MILQIYPTAEVVTFVMDVTNVKQVEIFHSTAVEKFGRIDFTANVAGYGHLPNLSIKLESSEIVKSFAVNLKGVRSVCAHSICLH
jgi:NAD(P)-dependent dehydrogenase (short-subunit alcohol dehydrogenase family)